VSCAGEVPSNRIVWESLTDQGVALRQVDVHAAEDPEAALMAACDRDTRLVAVSSVQYATGLRLDLARLGAFCREQGHLFCVDAIQSVGALRMDVEAIGADFLAADGHKWMLGPEGLAVFWVRPELRERLRLHQYGWHMVEDPLDFDRRDWEPAHSARRFEAGSPNLLCAHALSASLSLLSEVGMETVQARVLDNARDLMQRIAANPRLELVTPSGPGRHGGIVTFRVPGVDPDPLYRRLMAQRVVCARRGGGIRFSPHFYSPRAVLDRALDSVDRLLD
jgi:cysteine desulfurase/selenocysteine lyase